MTYAEFDLMLKRIGRYVFLPLLAIYTIALAADEYHAYEVNKKLPNDLLSICKELRDPTEWKYCEKEYAPQKPVAVQHKIKKFIPQKPVAKQKGVVFI